MPYEEINYSTAGLELAASKMNSAAASLSQVSTEVTTISSRLKEAIICDIGTSSIFHEALDKLQQDSSTIFSDATKLASEISQAANDARRKDEDSKRAAQAAGNVFNIY